MVDSKNGIIGLAIGDAMGVPLEFCKREDLIKNPTTTMKGYGSHDVPKGSWSDDTSMTIATIDAIIADKGINCNTIVQNFLNWLDNDQYTATGTAFDVGRTCLQALIKFSSAQENAQNCGIASEYANGNGSLMRILPIAYYCKSRNMNEKNIYEIVKNVSSITHKHEISILGCFIYVMYAIELLSNKSLLQSYEKIKEIDYTKYFSEETIDKYSRILKNNIFKYNLEEISSSGYVINTLEAVFWVLLNTNSYNEAIVGAINLGDDTDTVGACLGGLAGIYYGLESISKKWKNDLLKYDYIADLCDKFNKILNS